VLEVMALRSVTSMRHDVHFTTWTWDATARVSNQLQRAEVNEDKTEILGLHTKYVRPVGSEGWRVGVQATANQLQHPKIPNYVLQSVPRDPGTTNAFAVGVGAAREMGPSTFGAELVLEPMTSNTWADMLTDFKRADGSVIKAGDRTMENHFTFRNARGGLSGGHTFVMDTTSGSAITLNFGLVANSISYDLLQTNNMTRTLRSQHEHWVEAGPSFGIRMTSRDIEFSYAFRGICGSDCTENNLVSVIAPNASVPDTGGIIAAPSAPLRLQTGRETSHHFMISIPIR
jgi:hypothetical protein